MYIYCAFNKKKIETINKAIIYITLTPESIYSELKDFELIVKSRNALKGLN
jgi:hypothetical protein